MSRRMLRLAVLPLVVIVLLSLRAGPAVETAGAAAPPESYVPIPSDPWVPDFAHPRVTAGPIVSSVRDGLWSDAATWGGTYPDGDAVVRIVHQVGFDTHAGVRVVSIRPGGRLHFLPDVHTRLDLATLQALPGGTLEIGTAGAPVTASAEVVFTDAPIEATDPGQYGNGLLVMGEIVVHGRPLEPTFIRLAREPRAGDRTLLLESTSGDAPNGWTPGDRLFIPDTRQHPVIEGLSYDSQGEEATIRAVQGARVTLDEPLRYDHHGARDAGGRVDLLPHIVHLSRNVVFRSANPTGTRGHVMLADRAHVDIRGARFADLGRTTIKPLSSTEFDARGRAVAIGENQIARYALHLHHLNGPVNQDDTGFQFTLENNVVERARKWGVVNHGSHYGLIRGNVVYGFSGAGFVMEDGNESYNLVERNFAVMIRAGESGIRPVSIKYLGGFSGGVRSENPFEDFGFEGSGFWMRLPHNYFRGNVAANVRFAGFNLNGAYRSARARVPTHRGQAAAEGELLASLPLLEFSDNEVYGGAEHGVWTTWWAGSAGRGEHGITAHANEGILRNLRIWHITRSGIRSYHNSRLTFESPLLRSDPAVSASNRDRVSTGFDLYIADVYENGQMTLRNADIQGFNVGIALPGYAEDGFLDEPNRTVIEDGRLANYVNIQEVPSQLGGEQAKETVIRDVVFESLSIARVADLPPRPTDIWMRYLTHPPMRLTSPSRTYVYNYRGDPGADLVLFFREQRPGFSIQRYPGVYAGQAIEGCMPLALDGLRRSIRRLKRESPLVSRLIGNNEAGDEGLNVLTRLWRRHMFKLWRDSDATTSNADCWREFGRALAGDMAPCADDQCSNRLDYPEIEGYAFPMADEPERVSVSAGST